MKKKEVDVEDYDTRMGIALSRLNYKSDISWGESVGHKSRAAIWQETVQKEIKYTVFLKTYF